MFPVRLEDGVIGEWVIDDTATPVVNRAGRDWQADYFCRARKRHDVRGRLQSATGFGNKYSSHCTFSVTP